MRDITLCHPRLQTLAKQLVDTCAAKGLKIKTTETLRTTGEQDALYAQGRTKPGNIVTNAKGSTCSSMHQWGIAFDFCRNDGQGAYNESGKFFEKVGAIGTSLGLEWGGNWTSIVDRPHFQLPDWGSSTSGIKKSYKTPEEFIKTWKVDIETGWIKDSYGWWYRKADGTFPANKWCIINHHWYLFNRDGYACTNWHRWDGQICDPDDGSGNWYYFDTTKEVEGACWHERDDKIGVLELWNIPDKDTI